MTKNGLLPVSRGLVSKKGGFQMTSQEEAILKATKEIIVKFIETGRIFPGQFEEVFKKAYKTIRECVKEEN